MAFSGRSKADRAYDVHPIEIRQARALQTSELCVNLTSDGVCAPLPVDCEGLRSSKTINLINKIRQRNAAAFINSQCAWSGRHTVEQAQSFLPNKPLDRPLTSFGSRAYNVRFSRDGSRLVAASQHQIRVFETPDWEHPTDIEVDDVSWAITSVDFSPNGESLLYTSMDDQVRIVQVPRPSTEKTKRSRMDTRVLPATSHHAIYQARFSPDGTRVLVASGNGHVSLKLAETGETVFTAREHEDDVNAAIYLDEDGNMLASASDDNTIHVWDIRCPTPLVGSFIGHEEGVTALDVKRDGSFVISNGKDQCLKLWDRRAMVSAGSVSAWRKEPSYDYRWQDYPGQDLPPHHHPWDGSVMTYRGHHVIETLVRCSFSPAATTGERYIYTGSADGAVYIYETLTGQIASVLKGPHRGNVRDVAWHPYAPVMASASFDRTVQLWQYSEDWSLTSKVKRWARERNVWRARARNREKRRTTRGTTATTDAGIRGTPRSARNRRRTGMFDDYGSAAVDAAESVPDPAMEDDGICPPEYTESPVEPSPIRSLAAARALFRHCRDIATSDDDEVELSNIEAERPTDDGHDVSLSYRDLALMQLIARAMNGQASAADLWDETEDEVNEDEEDGY